MRPQERFEVLWITLLNSSISEESSGRSHRCLYRNQLGLVQPSCVGTRWGKADDVVQTEMWIWIQILGPCKIMIWFIFGIRSERLILLTNQYFPKRLFFYEYFKQECGKKFFFLSLSFDRVPLISQANNHNLGFIQYFIKIKWLIKNYWYLLFDFISMWILGKLSWILTNHLVNHIVNNLTNHTDSKFSNGSLYCLQISSEN